MKYIGLDIGSTSISGLLLDGNTGKELRRKTIRNNANNKTRNAWEHLQNAEHLAGLCGELVEALAGGVQEIGGIGITGQMHGIVYVDKAGQACSPLITWQDERGNLLNESGQTYCKAVKELTGWNIATGYGLMTVYYDSVHQRIPAAAAGICTIGDYIAMKLCGLKKPLLHVSNAAGLGFFDLEKAQYDWEAIAKSGIDTRLLPEVSCVEQVIGTTKDHIPVIIALGDNQASFLGAVGNREKVLINIGTGSQVSAMIKNITKSTKLEYRPYIDGKYLLIGAGLCGGGAYGLLEKFIHEVSDFVGAEYDECLMQKLDAAAEKVTQAHNHLQIDTRFRGTRTDPHVRGRITEIGTDNFTIGHLAYATMRGMCMELYNFYQEFPAQAEEPDFLVGSGNALRNSAIEKKILTDVFQKDIKLPESIEEAAYGSALLAIHVVEKRSWNDLNQMIKYI